MKFKVVGKSLILTDCSHKITEGENSFDTVEIAVTHYHDDCDLSTLSFRFSAISEDGKNSAVQILRHTKCDEKYIYLKGTITSDFSAITGKVIFMLTGLTGENVVAKFQSTPYTVSDDISLMSLPDHTAAEQLFNLAQLEAQKAIDAADRAEKASLTPAPAEIYPAAEVQLGGVLSGNDISVGDDGTVTVNSVKGKTLGKSVPADAVFTDTVYTLPKATENNLGGIKSGGDVTVEEDGTVTVINSENLKSEIAELKSLIGLTESDIVGLHADFENNIFTRIAGAVGKNAGSDFNIFPMYGGRKRCNVLDDGTITAYYGDNNFAEDGSNGQVMVYQPKFYYKVVPIKLDPQTNDYGYHLRCANYYISAVPKNGFKLHPAFYGEDGEPVDYILFSAYEGSIYDTSENAYLQNDEQTANFAADKFSSIAGVKPCSGTSQNLTRPNIEQLAKNRGKGWHMDTIKATCANQMLMIIEFASFDTQNAIGQGVVSIDNPSRRNCAVNTGKTSSLGSSTGSSYGENGKTSISYRGMENPWGNIWKFINGINSYADNNKKNHGYICSSYNFEEDKSDDDYVSIDFAISAANGYISAFGYSESFDWLFLTSETSSSSKTYINDYHWSSTMENQWNLYYIGGNWVEGSNAGYFNIGLDHSSIYSNYFAGGRLIYIPYKKNII